MHESVVLFHSTDGFDKCSYSDLRRLILQNLPVIYSHFKHAVVYAYFQDDSLHPGMTVNSSKEEL